MWETNIGYGTVKSVLSGDTVVLLGTSKVTYSCFLLCQSGPAPELQLSLAYCQAPRVARSADGVEEPFGWESREYLRKLLIGNVVKFKVLYTVATINRKFGSLELEDQDVLRKVVSDGMVTVRAERNEKDNTALYEELLELQAAARNSHKGIWGPHPTARTVQWTLPDPQAFFQSKKKLPLAGVIEQVRDGSTFRVYLYEGGEYITLHLAGIQSPKITYSADGQGTPLSSKLTSSDLREVLSGGSRVLRVSSSEPLGANLPGRYGQIRCEFRGNLPRRPSSAGSSTRKATSLWSS